MSAIVIGAGGGIGAALVAAIADEDVPVRGLTRADLDLTDESSIARAAAAAGSPDLVIVATGLLHADGRGPERSIRELDADWMARNFAINAIGPALVAKHFLPILPKTGRSVLAILSARVGSITDNRLGGWYGYRASKAALNQLIRTLSIEDKRRNPSGLVVGLHPGTVDTALSKPFQSAGRDLFAPDRAAVQLLDALDALKPQDSGKVFAWDGAEIAP